MSRRWRAAIVVAAAIVLVNVVLGVVQSVTGGSPGGPDSSSYSTGDTGLAAYAELVAHAGHPVERVRAAPSRRRLDPRTTVVLIDPGLVAQRDADALHAFVIAGGRLVAGGVPTGWLGRLLASPPRWTPARVTGAHALAPAPETANVGHVETRSGSWTGGDALPLLGRARLALLDTVTLGKGRILLLADSTPLQNGALAVRDDAALGLALAGPVSRPVAFLEHYHGYGETTGLAAIPTHWIAALALAALAALVLMGACARRLGPPQLEQRPLPPPRREFVESLAGVLARSGDRDDAVARLRSRANEVLAQRVGLARDSDLAALRSAAEQAGVPAELAAALVIDHPDERAMIEAGRALARLERAQVRSGG